MKIFELGTFFEGFFLKLTMSLFKRARDHGVGSYEAVLEPPV